MTPNNISVSKLKIPFLNQDLYSKPLVLFWTKKEEGVLQKIISLPKRKIQVLCSHFLGLNVALHSRSVKGSS